MKLLIDAHVFDGKYQGTRTYIQGIYSFLKERKDIDFYFTAHNLENLQSIFGKAENIHYIRLQSKNNIIRLLWEFPRIIQKYKIDYAHYQYIVPLIKCCKEIVTIHDLLFLDYPQYFSWKYRLKNNFFFKIGAHRADVLLTVSPFSKNEIVNHYGIRKDKIGITPNGVLLPPKDLVMPGVRQKYNLDKFILTVSRIEPRKNHQMLLKAYCELELWKEGYKLVIVGAYDIHDKDFDTYYACLAEKIKEYILIFPASYPELIELYKNASLFIFPSFAEGFGIPPIEATALGCTTLCSNQTAMSDFDFFSDKLFDPSSIEELKSKITYYLNNPDLSINKEQEEISKRYNWSVIAEDLYQILLRDQHSSI